MNRRIGVAVGVVVLLAAVGRAAVAQPVDDDAALQERLRLLEQRVQRLEQRLLGEVAPAGGDAAGHGKGGTAPAPPAAAPKPPTPPAVDHVDSAPPADRVEPAPQPRAVEVPREAGQAQARLFLFRDAGALAPGGEPDARGLVPFEGDVSFRPQDYGVGEGGLFSRFDDPSLYPAVGVNLSGRWTVQQDGVYRFLAHPKPAREGGSAVKSELTFAIFVDGMEVFAETTTDGWRRIERTVELTAGEHRVEIRALARSPGFGPSPIDSRLGFEVVAPGQAAPRPLALSTR